MILTVLAGLTSSNSWSSSASVDDVHLSFSILLLHHMTCIFSSDASHKGHTSKFLNFHSLIFSLVPQYPDTCFVVQIFWSKGSGYLVVLITSQSMFSFWSAGNRPCLFQYFKILLPWMRLWIVLVQLSVTLILLIIIANPFFLIDWYLRILCVSTPVTK